MTSAAIALAPALALGSFLNVVATRVPERKSLVAPRSACPSCDHELAWRDNIPVLSYLLLRGRCRYCRARISLLYPAVEITTAVLVVACIAVFGPTAYGALAAAFCAILVVLSAIDVRKRIVPNRIVVPAGIAVLAARTAIDPSLEWLIAALAAFAFFFVAALVHPSGLGMGDVKLAFLLGAMLGATVTVALLVGLVAALVPSIVLLIRHGSAARKMSIPLVPFLAFGSIVALFAGNALTGGYADLLS
jgi:prepilin signal peptidase PulO-like enzyme (type II secretory pathway)